MTEASRAYGGYGSTGDCVTCGGVRGRGGEVLEYV